MHTQCRFNNHRAHNVAPNLMGWMKTGNIVPLVRIEPTCPALHDNILTI